MMDNSRMGEITMLIAVVVLGAVIVSVAVFLATLAPARFSQVVPESATSTQQ